MMGSPTGCTNIEITQGLDPSFLASRRRVLTELRDQLRASKDAAHQEEVQGSATVGGEAREYEDEAQKLATRELAGTLESRATQRLIDVERALRKLDESTYGISDKSGATIARERLQEVPEAIYTLEEQNARYPRG